MPHLAVDTGGTFTDICVFDEESAACNPSIPCRPIPRYGSLSARWLGLVITVIVGLVPADGTIPDSRSHGVLV